MSDPQDASSPRWQPLEAIDRRILGVLVEKAKTTSDNYPLSLNALRGGCNQKSNRFPQMQIEEEPLEEALERLRELGAVAFIQGGSRVDKYRHLAYDWLGVDKIELAVMAELLLRGAQTVGELRGRAARMEPIKGLEELRPILDHLQAKGLLLYLTPKGRGAVVAHTLYLDRELEKVRREHGGHPAAESSQPPPSRPVAPPGADPVANSPPPPPTPGSSAAAAGGDQVRSLQETVHELRAELQQVKSELGSTIAELRRDLDELNRQLGN